jgi:hypothetical protein
MCAKQALAQIVAALLKVAYTAAAFMVDRVLADAQLLGTNLWIFRLAVAFFKKQLNKY